MDVSFVINFHWPLEVSMARIGLALGLGFLVGMERERAGKDVGLRTFSLTCMLGSLSWMASPVLGFCTLLFVLLMTVLINVQSLMRNTSTVVTTSVTLFLTAMIGILVGAGETFVPTAVTIFIVALLSWKEALVSFSTGLNKLEIRSAITLAILAFVIYPLLPGGYIDPWRVINLRSTWLTVIMISAIGFGNYILLRLYGARGVAYTGFLGGLVSSAATVTELAAMVKRSGQALRSFALRGMRLANLAMLLRNGLILTLLTPAALVYPFLPLVIMIIVSLGLTFTNSTFNKSKSFRPLDRVSNRIFKTLTFSDKRQRLVAASSSSGSRAVLTANIQTLSSSNPSTKNQSSSEDRQDAPVGNSSLEDKPPSLTLSSPFSLKAAIKYGAIFLAITILAVAGQRLAGPAGFFLVSFIGGFVSSASASATAATLALQGKISMAEAGIAALLASLASALIQVVLADRFSGDRSLSRRMLLENALIYGIGAAVFAAQIGLEAGGIINLTTWLDFGSLLKAS